ncbi:MAG: hypothetical protein AB7P52_18495 [Alphaproteobacteria bacterium]
MSGAAHPPETISEHHYPFGALAGDYFRAGIGLLFTMGPLAATAPLAPVTGVLAAFGALFAVYGGRTVIRHCTVIRLSAKGMEAKGPLGARIAWRDVNGLTLRYFSTKRDRTGGWMQLKIRGKGRALRIDSAIDDFDAILRRAVGAAREGGVRLDSSSVENLRLRGVRLGLDETGAP